MALHFLYSCQVDDVCLFFRGTSAVIFGSREISKIILFDLICRAESVRDPVVVVLNIFFPTLSKLLQTHTECPGCVSGVRKPLEILF